MAELHEAYTEKEEDTFYRICRFLSASKLFKTENGLILDVGCNDAMFRDFLPSSIRYIGVDVSVPALRKARDKGVEVIRTHILNLPFRQAIFDSMFSIEVIEHIPMAREAVLEMKRVLKKGASLIITVPNLVNIYNRMLILIGRGPGNVCREEHFHQYTPRSLDEFLQSCGLKVVDKGKLVAHPIVNETFGKLISIVLPKNMHAHIVRRAIKP